MQLQEINLSDTIETTSLRDIIRLLTDCSMSLGLRLNKSLDFILNRVNARHGSIMLVSPEQEELRVEASANQNIIGMAQKIIPESISGYVFQNQLPLLIKDINNSDRFKPRNGRISYRTTSLLCVPLLDSQQNTMGVINCSDRSDDSQFSTKDCQILQEYAAWISPLVENSRLMEKLSQEKERYKSLVQELELKQKELWFTYTERSELIQMVVHDFKSPLSAVISNLDILTYMGVIQKQEKVIQTAHDGATRLLEMINKFLEVARLDQWQEENAVHLGPTSLLPIVEQVLDEARPTALAKNQNLSLEQEQDATVIADGSLLSHLMTNLISNAIKYTPAGGDIKVFWEIMDSRRAEDKYGRIVKISVQDTGPGICDELKSRIFNRFHRGDSNHDIQGTGIGLFLCNRITTMLQGNIWVEDAPGGGSIFCVTLYSPN